jgi:hypothetical protein
MKDSGGKIFLKKHRKHPGALALMDLTRIGLIIVEHQELAGADSYCTIVDAIPFFARERRLYRKAADVVRTMALPAKSIENHVLLFEPVEMGLFVEAWDAMIGQLGEVHS